ncbi:membrane hypothetical protein [uncultured Gammaproteobacteria bacterium]
MKAVAILAFCLSLFSAILAPVQVSLAMPPGLLDSVTVIHGSEAATGTGGAQPQTGGPQTGGPQTGTIVTNRTVFFGCVIGGALGALTMMLPPIAGWTIWAGSLPSVIAFATAIGTGCAVGMFGAAFISTLAWVLQGIADFFTGRWW